MKRFFLILVSFICFSYNTFSQIHVTGNVTDTTLAGILRGRFVIVSNVHYTGFTWASGYFYGPSSLPYTNGIALTTGRLSFMPGPNNQPGASFDNKLAGDSNLNQICGLTTHDASVLEFDLIPYYDNFQMNFVFASEEYPEYATDVKGSFFDIMGIFVTGPRPSNNSNYIDTNIAIIPVSGLPISVSTINNGPTNTGPCVSCGYYYNNTGDSTIQYDGRTTDMTASIPTKPGATYHVKIAVADVNDYWYDSAVILQAGSLISSGPLSVPSLNHNIGLSLFPNPANDVIWINSSNEPIQKVNVIDMTGKIVLEMNENSIQSISVNNLDQGVYIVELYSTHSKTVRKLIKN